MGEYGFRIKNYQAGSIYEYMTGVREIYDSKDAMLTNSLFLDYLQTLKDFEVIHDISTRDIICLEFNYGSRTYEQEVKHLEKLIKEINNDSKIKEEKKEKRLERLNYLLEQAHLNKDKFDKKSAAEIRKKFYNEGVTIEYKKVNKRKKVTITKIHYKMLYRTPGKAKKGSCMFIKDSLYKDARKFLYMGLKLPEKNAPIVEIGAYSSLTTSTIIDKIKINPNEILIVNDVDSFFDTKVVSVELDKDKRTVAKTINNYHLKNTLFDGQALIDSSIFPEWGDGYILLRHHFFKAAAFCTHIQKFFREYYQDSYDTATVLDMWGRKIPVKNIKLITTDNAIKWLKFNVGFEYWADWVRQNECKFGIVKTAHPSKFGDVQRMSYQMINSLNIDTMDETVNKSVTYIKQLQRDDDTFLAYLDRNKNFSNDYEVLVALVNQDRDFVRSEYFRQRKYEILRGYINNFKSGKVLQEGDNLVIVGSPYAMLLHAVGEDVENDDTFFPENSSIQCWTARFKDGEYLAEFRNPFNSRNNLGHLHNVYNEKFDRYFNFGELVIAVNMIHTDFQDRNNGSDQDSDSIFVTNAPSIVSHAEYCYLNYPTVVNNIPKEKNHYNLSMNAFAFIDNMLAASQLSIGESSNLAQVCLSYTYSFPDKKYEDFACILAVIAQASIDSAKRAYDIDIPEEIKRIKIEMNVTENKYPNFWLLIRRGFNKKRINPDLKCPMNYLYDLKIGATRSSLSTLPMSVFYKQLENTVEKNTRTPKRSKKVEKLIEDYSLHLYTSHQKYANDQDSESARDNNLLLRNDFEELIENIRRTYISDNYRGLMSWLINRAFVVTSGAKRTKKYTQSKIYNNRAILMRVLYEVNPNMLLECFSKNIEND